jgi:cytochrome c-type biogenesis protein CcmF
VRQGEFTLKPGQTAFFDGHRLTYQHLSIVVSANKIQTSAIVKVDGNGPYGPGISAFREPDGTTNPVGTPSISSTPAGDVALALLEVPSGGSTTVTLRATAQPLVMWLWVGGGIIAIGTAMAAFPGRRRRPTQPVSAPVPERHSVPPRARPPAREPESVNARIEPA